jgi:hypothetical protein
MPIGASSRVVIVIDDVELKRRLHAVLAAEGKTLKDWFLEQAKLYLSRTPQQPALPLDSDEN